MDMIQFTDLSWETEEELLASLKKFFEPLQTDLCPRNAFHDVYHVWNTTQLSMRFEEFSHQFDHLDPPTTLKKKVITVMYFGDKKHRYRFTSESVGSKTVNFIREEILSDIVPDYYAKTTCECSMKLFVKAMILLEKIGRKYFVIHEEHLELTCEDVEYRLHRMVGETEDYGIPHTMTLLWADSHDPKYLNVYQSLFYKYFTSKFFVDLDVTKDHSYSEWGFWKKINRIEDDDPAPEKVEAEKPVSID